MSNVTRMDGKVYINLMLTKDIFYKKSSFAKILSYQNVLHLTNLDGSTCHTDDIISGYT